MNYKSVLAQLQMQSDLIDWSGMEEKVKQMCAMACIRTAVKGYLEEVEDEEFHVSNGIAEMPMECVRVVRVRDGKGHRVRYNYTDGVIKLLDYLSLNVVVDYWRMPLDEEGLPKVTMQNMDYCVATCEFYAMRDKWLEQKINNSQFGVFQERMSQAYNRAVHRKITVDEMERATWMMRNGIFYKNFDILKSIF